MPNLPQPTFLYPTSREFPFDEVCEQIARALELRNWSVPGLQLRFENFGTGKVKLRKLYRLVGEDFTLWFFRKQGHISCTDNTAAVALITIPQMRLNVDDEADPELHMYVGPDWRRDKQWFLTGDQLPWSTEETVLDYQLVPDSTTLRRPYDPRHEQHPATYETDAIFAWVAHWLRKNVLATIEAAPLAEKIDHFSVEMVPMPPDCGPFFCFGEAVDADRVGRGLTHPDDFYPEYLHGFVPDRGLPGLHAHEPGATAAKGRKFLWCGFGQVGPETNIASLEVPGLRRSTERELFLFQISPKYANDIWVVDHGAYVAKRDELLARGNRRRLCGDEPELADDARARTIVPLAEYGGDFQQPLLLVGRELNLDEVVLVSGRWPEFGYLHVLLQDASARPLTERVLTEREIVLKPPRDSRPYERALDELAECVMHDEQLFPRLVDLGETLFGRKQHRHIDVLKKLIDALAEARYYGLLA